MQVGREHSVPLGSDGIPVGRGDVELLLFKRVVYQHQGGIGIQVAHVIVRVLGVDQQIVFGRDALLINALREEAPVPLPLGVLPLVVHDRPGDAPFRVVEIGF